MEGVKLWWDSAAAGTPQYAPLMFKKETSKKNYEEYAQSVGLGLAVMKPEGQPISYDGMSQGFHHSRHQRSVWSGHHHHP